jgi:pSer/pThr/pTyr-binding forkhead associated (FHA) protein
MRHPLEPPGIVIGRGAEADLRINDPGISRRHVEIRVQPSQNPWGGTGVSVVDLGSTNGMLVNGVQVEQADLDDGGTIKIGNTTMTVRVLAHPGGHDLTEGPDGPGHRRDDGLDGWGGGSV